MARSWGVPSRGRLWADRKLKSNMACSGGILNSSVASVELAPASTFLHQSKPLII